MNNLSCILSCLKFNTNMDEQKVKTISIIVICGFLLFLWNLPDLNMASTDAQVYTSKSMNKWNKDQNKNSKLKVEYVAENMEETQSLTDKVHDSNSNKKSNLQLEIGKKRKNGNPSSTQSQADTSKVDKELFEDHRKKFNLENGKKRKKGTPSLTNSQVHTSKVDKFLEDHNKISNLELEHSEESMEEIPSLTDTKVPTSRMVHKFKDHNKKHNLELEYDQKRIDEPQGLTDAQVHTSKTDNKLLQHHNKKSNLKTENGKKRVGETPSSTSKHSHHSEPVSKDRSGNNAVVPSHSRLVVSPVREMKSILLWNTCIQNRASSECDMDLERQGCPVHQCSFTVDKSQVETVDAILFHGLRTELPEKRSENQIYVFQSFERQFATSRLSILPMWQDIFNLTFTHMSGADTDISGSQGWAVRLPESNPKAVQTLDEIKNRTKLVLWIVSNCRADSGRLEYAKLLAEYIPVDIVGRCGNMSCPLPKSSTTCILRLAKNYMFYLAFENSYCKDYYTEKITGPLRRGMVPIVMGAANYSRLLPPHSFIDANDFSPRQLAKKLLYLQKHTEEYMEYLQWKQDYKMLGGLRKQGFCRLCEILHTPNYPYKSNFNLAQYWDAETLCLTKAEHLAKLGIN